MKLKTILLLPFYPFILMWRLFKWAVLDTIDDAKFLKDVVKGDRPLVKQELQEEFKRTSISKLAKDVWKQYWWAYCLMAVCVLLGVFLSSQYYQGKCNQYIYDNYVSDFDKFGNESIKLPYGNFDINFTASADIEESIKLKESTVS